MGEATHEATAMTEDLKDELLLEAIARLTAATCTFAQHIDRDGVGWSKMRHDDVCALLGRVEKAERAEADATSLRAERDGHKSRADNHWETLRSIREMARDGDCERIILWVNDAGAGYTEDASVTMAKANDLAEQLRAERDAAVEALKWHPIETAPKDGRTLLMICNTAYAPRANAGWWKDGWRSYSRADEKWHGGVGEWFPTHWQPLPGPPSTQARAVVEGQS